MCYCEHCQRNFRGRAGLELPRTNDPHDPGAARVHRLAPAAAVRAVAAVGRRDPQDQSRRVLHPEHRRRRAESARHEDASANCAPTLFADRQARQRADAAVGQRQERQGVPRHAGHETDRRHLQRAASKSRTAGRTRCRATPRSASGWPTASPTACGRGSPSSPARCTTGAGWRVVEDIYAWHYRVRAVPAQRAAAGARRPWSTRSRRRPSTAPTARAKGRRPHPRLVPGAGRGAHSRSRWCTTGCSMPSSCGVQDAASCPISPRSRTSSATQLRGFVQDRRQPGGHVRDVPVRRVGRPPRRTSAWPICSASGSAAASRGRCRIPTCGWNATPAGRRHPLLAASTMRRGSSTVYGASRSRRAKQVARPPLTLIPSLSRSADGEGLSAGRRPTSPQVFLREIGQGRVVYFPWDIDRTFWEVLSVDHGSLLAQRRATGPPTKSRRSHVTGPGLLDVTVWRQKQSLTVHLVNLTNPMMMKGPLRELLPPGTACADQAARRRKRRRRCSCSSIRARRASSSRPAMST